jgi:hypothetical protein
MSVRRFTYSLPPLALIAAAGILACSSSTGSSGGGGNCTGTTPALNGTYALLSYTYGGQTIQAPPASGTLALSADTLYSAHIDIPSPPAPTPQAIFDSGKVSLTGANCISQSSYVGNPQFTGTYTLSNTGVLSVTGSAAGITIANTWQKQ